MATAHSDKIYCALDTPNLETALSLASSLKSSIGGAKVGLEFFSSQGPWGVKKVVAAGLPVFLDLKLHDIPNTVAKAVTQLVPLGPKMITLHAQGGLAMMKAAADAAANAAGQAGVEKPKLLGVSVLTSLNDDDLEALGIPSNAQDQVKRLAELTCQAGLEGVVCSPFEIGALRDSFGQDLILVVPGIRPAGVDTGDQKRVMTPKQAMDAGADYLVIGRAITGADDPATAAAAIADSLKG